MLLNQLNTSNHARLAQIIHTLRSVHGFDLPTDQSHCWHSLAEHYQKVQATIMESSSFNSYHTNPEYTKAALITEAVRILFEIAPRRRKHSVKESNNAQESTMTNLRERNARPDFLDLDDDGDTHEPMKQAARQAKHKDVEEAKNDPQTEKEMQDALARYKGPVTYGKTKKAKGSQPYMMGSYHRDKTGSALADLPVRVTSIGKPALAEEAQHINEYVQTIPSDEAFDRIRAAGASNVRTTSDAIQFVTKQGKKQIPHHNSPDGHRYVKVQDLNKALAEIQGLQEKWDAEMTTAAKDVGKWEGYTIAELRARKKKLMDKAERSAAEQKEVSQINFAIRAKQKDSWGKIRSESMLMEDANLDQAETLLAAKDISDRLQNMAEDAAKMAVDKLMPLVDTMKSQFGQPAAEGFNTVVKAQLQTVLDAIIAAKDETDNAIMALQSGGTPAMTNDISSELPDQQPSADAQPADFDNQFAAMPATSGEPDQPLGRTMKADISETHDGHKFKVGDRVKFDYARGMKPLRGEVVEIVAAAKTEKNPLGYTVDVRSGNSIYSLHPNHPVKLDEAQNNSPTQDLKDMAATGKDKNGRPLNPLQKQAMNKAANELTKAKLEEKLTKKMTAAEIIKDFVNSDDPKFQGKSKKKRTQMALGAYYGMHPEKRKQQESIQHLQAVVESLLTEFRLLQEQFNQHKVSYKQNVMEGTVSDPLGTGYGIQGAALLQKLRTVRDQIQEARTEIADIRDQQQQQLVFEAATQAKMASLVEQQQTTPYGVVAVTAQGSNIKKFFESADHRSIWMQYNQHNLSTHKLIDPQDLDAVHHRLARTINKQ
jgi:hypothetical protein